MDIKKLKKRYTFIRKRALSAAKFIKTAVCLGFKAKDIYSSVSKVKK